MSSAVAVLSFPGSNGDHDALWAVREGVGVTARLVDYRETDLAEYAAVIVPGGFSYGDHLRPGAIARFAPVMRALREFAARGGPVLGICNGFQILTEAELLPGALLRNRTLQFHCHWASIEIVHTKTAWTNQCRPGQRLRLPVAHGDGSFFAGAEELNRLEQEGRVIARYHGPVEATSLDREAPDVRTAIVSRQENPNGSLNRIAGIVNERGNVVGLMPHPERAADPLVNGEDGLLILRSGLAAAGATA